MGNIKIQLINELNFWIDIERDLKIKNEHTTIHDYKITAYKKVLDQIRLIRTINSWEDLENVKGIGKSIKIKLEPIFNQTHTVDEKTCNNDVEKVYGIGPATALKLMKDHNILTVEDLHRANSRNLDLLNRVQKIGLKYHNDLFHPIPRKEMDAHNKFINKILYIFCDETKSDNLIYSIVGSYRRKAKQSSDIDLIISVPEEDIPQKDILHDIVETFKHHNYIKDVLSLGDRKFMGIVKLPSKTSKKYRRLDILITSKREYPFALLYFTGSKNFNIEFRKNAKEHNVVLNEYGIFDNKGRLIDLDIHTEADIFNYFNVPYLDPEYRI
jgi:DNA polymerase beta